MKRYLHVGCGSTLGASWVNLDGDINTLIGAYWDHRGWRDEHGNWTNKLLNNRFLRRSITVTMLLYKQLNRATDLPVIIHDVRKPFPFSENSYHGVYGSHVLEHLYYDEAAQVLHELKRVLVPAGYLRIVVPDAASIMNRYLERTAGGDTDAAAKLNAELNFHPTHAPKSTLIQRLWSDNASFHTHKYMYDSASLQKIIGDAGFVAARQCEYLDSHIPTINEVEKPARLLDGAGICVEAQKPA